MAVKRGFGKTWWGSAWVDALQRIDFHTNRLPRGRSYANTGKVREIQIDAEGQVKAKVQGTRSTPYRVAIRLTQLSSGEQKKVKSLVAWDPALASELSLGRLPESILELLESKDIYLLPESWDSISGSCSCPDWANPCKHLAAVYYIIAGEIDKDPFILFKLKGLKTGDLLEAAGFASPGDTDAEQPDGAFAAPGSYPVFVSCADLEEARETHLQPENGRKTEGSEPKTAPVKDSGFEPAPGKNAGLEPDLGSEPASALAPGSEPAQAPETEPGMDVPDAGPDVFLDLSDLVEDREGEAIFALLQPSPLFYPGGNFKTLLLTAYRNVAKAVEKLALLEDDCALEQTEYTLLYPPPTGKSLQDLTFFVSPPDKASAFVEGEQAVKTRKIPCREGEKLVPRGKKGVLLPAERVLDKFLVLPQRLSLDKTSSGADFLSAAAALVQALARSFSFVPEVRWAGGDSVRAREQFIIVYRPLERGGKLRDAMAHLAALMPPGFIYQAKGQAVLPGLSGVREFLTIYLTYLVHRFSGMKVDDKISAAFFRGDTYCPERFEEQQNARAIANWFGWLNLEPVHISPVLNLKLPSPEIDAFRLQIRVEDKRDPLASTRPLQDVFTSKGEIFSRPVREVRQEVARQLTIAGEYIPVLKKLVKHRGTKQAKLSSSAVSTLLAEGKQVCALLGIRVAVPRELKELARPALALAAHTLEGRDEQVSYLNLDKMLEFSWEISLGDQTISREEFMELARGAEGIVRFRDRYLMLDPAEAKKILDQLEEPLPQLSSTEVLRAAVTGDVEGMPFLADDQLQKLLDDLEGERTRQDGDFQLPTGLAADLRPYQVRGVRWLYANSTKGLGSCLADDMGLGKTVQVLALLLKYKEEDRLEHPVLVVCPTTLLGNWVKECEKFAPALRVGIYHGNDRRLATRGVDLVITSYGILRRDREKFKRKLWDLVIIDEAQNIKNPRTDQAKAVKSIGAKSYIAMSGTPVENRLMELWSIFDFINRGYLGSRQDFFNNMAVPIEKYRDGEKIRKLKQATAPFLLRRLKSDKKVIQDLPQKTVKSEYCFLSKEQAALYQQVTDSMMQAIEQGEGFERKGLVFKLMTALKQICNHPVQYTKKGTACKSHSGKAEKALSILEAILGRGEKALLFTQYWEMGELLLQLIREELQEEAYFFHGGLSRKKRDQLVEDFQTNKRGSPVMIISLKAGGSGLNLTAASHVIHYDLWWNPAVEEQATDRTYRIGQKQDIQVHRLLSLGTFEERIDEMISAKKELAELTVSAGENSLSELSNAELRSLFTLVQ